MPPVFLHPLMDWNLDAIPRRSGCLILCKLAEVIGFVRAGGRGSHTVYAKPAEPTILNFKNRNGNMPPYQARKTEAEAIHELHAVIELWIKAARKVGNPVPKPSDRADVNYSGKFLMRVPKRLHAELAHAAKAQGVSLNQYVLYLLTRGHGGSSRRAA